MPGIASLNWTAAFWRLRIVAYAVVAVVALWLGWVDRPTVKEAHRECYWQLRDVGPEEWSSYSAPEFCKALADLVMEPGGQPAEPRAREWQKMAEQESLWLVQLKHMGIVLSLAMGFAAVIEILSRCLVWVLRGLFAPATGRSDAT